MAVDWLVWCCSSTLWFWLNSPEWKRMEPMKPPFSAKWRLLTPGIGEPFSNNVMTHLHQQIWVTLKPNSLIAFKLNKCLNKLISNHKQKLSAWFHSKSFKIQVSIISPLFWNTSTFNASGTERHPSNHRSARRSRHAVAARRSHSVAVSNGSGESEHHQSSEGHDPAKPDRVMWGIDGKYNMVNG